MEEGEREAMSAEFKTGWHDGVMSCVEWMQQEMINDFIWDATTADKEKLDKCAAKLDEVAVMGQIKRSCEGMDEDSYVMSEWINQVNYGRELQKSIEQDHLASIAEDGPAGGVRVHEHGPQQGKTIDKLEQFLVFKEEANKIDDQQKWLDMQNQNLQKAKRAKAREHGLI